MNKTIFTLLVFLQTASFLLAQRPRTITEKDTADKLGVLYIQLEAGEDSVKRAKNFEEIRQALVPKLQYFDGAKRGRTIYPAQYDSASNLWIVTLPLGTYEISLQHLAFQPIKRGISVRADSVFLDLSLQAQGNIPFTYEDGTKYKYTLGSLNFAQTLVVHFADGDPIENKALIEEVAPEALRIQKLMHANAFYVTVPIPDSLQTLRQMLDEQFRGYQRPFEGFCIGHIITHYIELLQAIPNVQYANPTFYYDKRESEMLETDEIPKSDALKKKLLLQLTTN